MLVYCCKGMIFLLYGKKISFLYIGDVDYLAVVELVGGAEAFATLTAVSALPRSLVGVYLLALFGDNLHIVLPGVLDDGEVVTAKDLCHIHVHDHSHHEGDGKDHCHIEEVDNDAQRVAVVLLQD